MKLIVVLCLVAVVVAAPPPRINNPQDNVQIVRYDNDNIGLANYRYACYSALVRNAMSHHIGHQDFGIVKQTNQGLPFDKQGIDFVTVEWTTYQLTDGTAQEQQGELRNEGKEDEFIAVKGSFTWVGPDGVTYRITYTADENGYQPEIEQGVQRGPETLSAAVVASLLG